MHVSTRSANIIGQRPAETCCMPVVKQNTLNINKVSVPKTQNLNIVLTVPNSFSIAHAVIMYENNENSKSRTFI